MRSTPAFAACSKTRLDPSTFRSRVASLALRIANARCTTTSAPCTRSRTLASSVTSPWRYSVLRQPRSPGSKGRRAMPTIRFTERERSSASTIARPRSPVGPVMATVRPVVAMAGFYFIAPPRGAGSTSPALPRSRAGELAAALVEPLLAARQDVVPIGLDGVVPGAAAHAVAHAVLRADLVASAAAVYVGTAPVGGDDVVAGAGPDRHVALVGADPVGARAGVHEVAAQAGVDAVGAGPAEDAVGVGLAEERVGAGAAEHEVGPGARVDNVVVGARVDAVGAGAPDHEVDAVAAVHLVVTGAGLEEVVRAFAKQAVVAALAIDLVRPRGARELLAHLRADQRVRDSHRTQQTEEPDGRHQY